MAAVPNRWRHGSEKWMIHPSVATGRCFDAAAAVTDVARRYPAPDLALNQCSIACGHLTARLGVIGVSDLQQLEVSGPTGSTNPHPRLPAAHSVLRIGAQVVDVTWAQIDVQSEVPFKLYESLDDLRGDWTQVRDWFTSKVI